MGSSPYSSLLQKTRLPQPAIQRYAVTAVFQKLRAAPAHLGIGSDPGGDAVSQCLGSRSPAVADQAVRELCRLVAEDGAEVDHALLELQSSLEGCDPAFVPLFVKGIGFLCRLAFRRDPSWGRGRSRSVEFHPFLKVLSCRSEVQEELMRQVLLFIVHNRAAGMEAVSDFIRPVFVFSVLMVQSPGSFSVFAKDLLSSTASLSCSLPAEAIAIIRLLTECLHYFPSNNEEEFKYLVKSAENLVDAFVVILQQLVNTGMPKNEAQTCGMELLDTLLSICTDMHKLYSSCTSLVELSMRIIVVQRQLALPCLPEFSTVTFSLSVILSRVEFEHEQLSVLKVLSFVTEWMHEEEQKDPGGSVLEAHQQLLQIFPAINMLPSSSKHTTDMVTAYLSILRRRMLTWLAAQRKEQTSKAGPPRLPFRSKLGSILSRLLHHLWTEEQGSLNTSCLLEFSSKETLERKIDKQSEWLSRLRHYALSTIQKAKLTPASSSKENTRTGITLLLSSITSIFLVHPKFAGLVTESLSSLCTMEPKLSMTFLLATLFYQNVFCTDEYTSAETLLKVLEMLPMLASSSALVPFILQILIPMLQKDVSPMIYATAVRLLCKTWIVTDRVFGTLKEVLDTKAFSTFAKQKDICISLAASVRDVCRNNPDRGVDLISSVSSCIESRDSSVQALGFEAIAFLCEADVIDFYTAWDIIEMHMLDYSMDPVIAHGLCILLQWGAMDADAYFEASKNVVQILWDIGTSNGSQSGSLWIKARASAFKSLICYEVEHLYKVIPDIGKRSWEILLSEGNSSLLSAIERLIIRIINFEHINRRRLQKDTKVRVHKVEKLLDIFPRAMFSSAEKQKDYARELPGASLLCLTFTVNHFQNQQMMKDLSKVHGLFETALVEIAESLQLSRNLFIALLAVQSWKAFVSRWIRVATDDKASAKTSDRSSSVACTILKILQRLAENSIPRAAENIVLAIGAFCMVLPSSGYSVVSAASDFLLKWLFQDEHEHRQWSAAISLGLVSNCLHTTDKARKFEIANGLLKVINKSASCLVKGACGLGLGFACEHLLTRGHDDSLPEGQMMEAKLLGKVIRTLTAMISQLCPSSSNSLLSLCENIPLLVDDGQADKFVHPSGYGSNESDDSWCVAGLIIGLTKTLSGLYSIGAYDAVVNMRNILISCISLYDSSSQISCDEIHDIPLFMGSCLALPAVIAFCQRVDLADIDIPGLLNRYWSLISKLLAAKFSGTSHQNLIMASTIGAGSLLSCILNEGVLSMKFDDIKSLLDVIRMTYAQFHAPAVQLGGMFGVINAFGAGAGILTYRYDRPSLNVGDSQKDLLYIRGSMFANPALESLSTSMIQEIFVIAKESMDIQLRRNAAWAVSFLRHWWWSEDTEIVNDCQSDSARRNHQSSSQKGLVGELYSWLNDSEMDGLPNANTIASVLRCLSLAPRLHSSSSWGAIVRRCMKFGGHLSAKLQMMNEEAKILREECLHFSLAHANGNISLMTFLDEIVDGSRFNKLDLNLQCSLLQHLSDLMSVFSASRLEKLYSDLLGFFRSSTSLYVLYNAGERCLLRISFWKGLHHCLINASDKLFPISEAEKCIEHLLRLLPTVSPDQSFNKSQLEELTWVIDCLSMTPEVWLLRLLQVPKTAIVNWQNHPEVANKIIITSRLIVKGCLGMSELGKLKALILNSGSEGIFTVHLEIVSALYGADYGTKRQWLLDAVEISCVSEHPSTALQFVGLLSSQCCEYMPLQLLDSDAVLSDLPLTLSSLLLDGNWSVIIESLVANLWASTVRICKWAVQLQSQEKDMGSDKIDIDGIENHRSILLAHMLRQTCLLLKHHLPLEKQFKLAILPLP